MYITEKHTGKMETIQSLSTSNHENSFCDKMKDIQGSICQKCFADRMLKMYKGLRNCTKSNEYLKTELVKKKDIPFINALYFRFEAFGELETTIQLVNFFNIAKKNKHVNFSLFTKRSDILKSIKSKPSNLQIVLSSPMINKATKNVNKNVIDKIFTVYDKDYAIKNGIKINCGKLKCIDCLACYTKNNKTTVSELLK